ncbi:glycosyltransferase family 2 protein [Photobacterium rosenbergii]|uniref:glycosyltransferase family 2 protein n=1 Tax=Photobacterium rosenbergii TaxID=294936 RepID=UPI001C99D02F|nr:glycosyltransferase family 2 protein [Photobacterium rosenbergii]MBY5947154.1 glycosyltransferase family 2 protein [Photobacterium rosenbergii]
MRTLSALIISKNEEDRIVPCFESLKGFADEIILFDSGSTDKTVEIAKQYTDKVWVTEDWPGDGFQKARALEQASCDWVLIIDADEYLDDEMKDEIRVQLSDPNLEEVAFKLPWGNLILGKQMRHGRSSRAPKRLFKREGASITKVVVHAHVETEGKVSTLKRGYLMHNSLRGFDHLTEKTRVYAWETTKKYHKNKKPSLGVYFAVVRSIWTFFLIYVIRLGFLDGSRGLLMAMTFAQASFNKYAGLWYLEQEEKLKKNKK